MQELLTRIAGLKTVLIDGPGTPQLRIVFLHGYNMQASDLTPFAHSLAVPGVAYAFPQASNRVSENGYTWWPGTGPRPVGQSGPPRDLWQAEPEGRALARSAISNLIAELRAEDDGPIALAGFSQGGMLACDTVVMEQPDVVSLAMMSASCIALTQWNERRRRLAGVTTFVSHGREDSDLAFSAGQRLAHFVSSSGALLTWFPFSGGHEIPFPVWKRFKQFVKANVAELNRALPDAYEAH
jgi:phospholipase/carboxylesterase